MCFIRLLELVLKTNFTTFQFLKSTCCLQSTWRHDRFMAMKYFIDDDLVPLTLTTPRSQQQDNVILEMIRITASIWCHQFYSTKFIIMRVWCHQLNLIQKVLLETSQMHIWGCRRAILYRLHPLWNCCLRFSMVSRFKHLHIHLFVCHVHLTIARVLCHMCHRWFNCNWLGLSVKET